MELKCAIITAVLAVILYLIVCRVLDRTLTSLKDSLSVGTSGGWYFSHEIVMFGSVFLAYYVNGYLINGCS